MGVGEWVPAPRQNLGRKKSGIHFSHIRRIQLIRSLAWGTQESFVFKATVF